MIVCLDCIFCSCNVYFIIILFGRYLSSDHICGSNAIWYVSFMRLSIYFIFYLQFICLYVFVLLLLGVEDVFCWSFVCVVGVLFLFCLYVSVKGRLQYFLSFAHIFVFLWLLYSICACWLAMHDVLWMCCLAMFVWAHMPWGHMCVSSMTGCSKVVFQGPRFSTGVSFSCAAFFFSRFYLLDYFFITYVKYILQSVAWIYSC